MDKSEHLQAEQDNLSDLFALFHWLVAKNGWTIDELIDAIAPEARSFILASYILMLEESVKKDGLGNIPEREGILRNYIKPIKNFIGTKKPEIEFGVIEQDEADLSILKDIHDKYERGNA